MSERPYHHGNLRAALLAEAERTLRAEGVDRLSLRDLARRAGVSHGAPRRHFADRQALLDAVAESGYLRLGERMRAAIDAAGEDYEARLRGAASAWIRFATEDAALLELMNTVKRGQHSAALDAAFWRLFATFDEVVRQGGRLAAGGAVGSGDPDRLRLLLLAAVQGIAGLVTSGVADARQTEALIADMAAVFARGRDQDH